MLLPLPAVSDRAAFLDVTGSISADRRHVGSDSLLSSTLPAGVATALYGCRRRSISCRFAVPIAQGVPYHDFATDLRRPLDPKVPARSPVSRYLCSASSVSSTATSVSDDLEIRDRPPRPLSVGRRSVMSLVAS